MLKSMNFPTKLILICTMFLIGCNQFSEENVDNVLVPLDTSRLFDYWEHKFVSYSSPGEPRSNDLQGYVYSQERGRQWVFKNDSIYIMEHPISLNGVQHFIIKDDSLILPSIYFFPRRNKVIFSGDTLILEGLSPNKSNFISNYFLKTKHDTSELDFLISEKVNWENYLGRNLLNFGSPKDHDTLFPYIPNLDLRESNNVNFYSAKDTLFYQDSLGNHIFKFQHDNTTFNTLHLIYLNDTTEERILWFDLNTE